MTALMWACAGGHVNIARKLLIAWAEVNAWDETGMTALMYTADRGRSCRPCLDVSLTEWQKQLEFERCASLLLWSSSEVKDRNYRGRRAVMFASMNNDSDMVQLLLGVRAEVRCGDVDGWKSLMLTCKRGRAEVAGWLLSFRTDANHSNLGRPCVATWTLPICYSVPVPTSTQSMVTARRPGSGFDEWFHGARPHALMGFQENRGAGRVGPGVGSCVQCLGSCDSSVLSVRATRYGKALLRLGMFSETWRDIHRRNCSDCFSAPVCETGLPTQLQSKRCRGRDK